MTQHKTHQTTQPTTRLLLGLALAMVLLTGPAWARAPYWGADHRFPGGIGGHEGSVQSSHFHERQGYFSWPNHWEEGHGPASDYGHAGDTVRYGRVATRPGHWQAGYLPNRQFYQGAYRTPHCRLFHYKGEWDRIE